MYDNLEPLALFDVETLLYIQEDQVDKFMEEYGGSSVSENVAHTNQQTGGVHEIYRGYRGSGDMTRVRGHSSIVNRPTYQLCGKYSHVVAKYWQMFEESFTPTRVQSNLTWFQGISNEKHEASTSNPHAITIMAMSHVYSLLEEL